MTLVLLIKIEILILSEGAYFLTEKQYKNIWKSCKFTENVADTHVQFVSTPFDTFIPAPLHYKVY